jgi:hypothetical protein
MRLARLFYAARGLIFKIIYSTNYTVIEEVALIVTMRPANWLTATSVAWYQKMLDTLDLNTVTSCTVCVCVFISI